MENDAVLGFGGLGIAVGIVCLVGLATLGHRRERPRDRWTWTLVPAAFAVAAWLVLQIDWAISTVGDMGPDYPPTSTYGRYREELTDDRLRAFAASAWALVTGAIAVAALVARRRDDGLFGMLAVAALAAVATPAVLPSLLSRTPSDELRFHTDSAQYSDLGRLTVTACFDAMTYQSESDDELGPTGSKLCLDLTPTPQARSLVVNPSGPPVATPVAPPDPFVSDYDIGNALERQALQPGDSAAPLDLPGIEVVGQRWETRY